MKDLAAKDIQIFSWIEKQYEKLMRRDKLYKQLKEADKYYNEGDYNNFVKLDLVRDKLERAMRLKPKKKMMEESMRNEMYRYVRHFYIKKILIFHIAKAEGKKNLHGRGFLQKDLQNDAVQSLFEVPKEAREGEEDMQFDDKTRLKSAFVETEFKRKMTDEISEISSNETLQELPQEPMSKQLTRYTHRKQNSIDSSQGSIASDSFSSMSSVLSTSSTRSIQTQISINNSPSITFIMTRIK
jgi:hypothetical protein